MRRAAHTIGTLTALVLASRASHAPSQVTPVPSLASLATRTAPVTPVTVVSDLEDRTYDIEIRREGEVIERCHTPCSTALAVGRYSLIATGMRAPLVKGFEIKGDEPQRLRVGTTDEFSQNIGMAITVAGLGASAMAFDNLAYAVLPREAYIQPYMAQFVGAFQRDLALFTSVALLPAAMLLVWRGTNLTLESRGNSIKIEDRTMDAATRVRYQSVVVNAVPGGGLVGVTFNF